MRTEEELDELMRQYRASKAKKPKPMRSTVVKPRKKAIPWAIGEERVNSKGHVYIKLNNGKVMAKHRAIMQEYIGRSLIQFEVVHHVDGDKLNNGLDNLVVIPACLHNMVHRIRK